MLRNYLRTQEVLLILSVIGMTVYAAVYAKSWWKQGSSGPKTRTGIKQRYNILIGLFVALVVTDVFFNTLPGFVWQTLVAESVLLFFCLLLTFAILPEGIVSYLTGGRGNKAVYSFVSGLLMVIAVLVVACSPEPDYEYTKEQTHEWSVALCDLGEITFTEPEFAELDLAGEYLYQTDETLRYLYIYEGIAPTPGSLPVKGTQVIIAPSERPRIEWYSVKVYRQEYSWLTYYPKEDKTKAYEYAKVYVPDQNWPVVILSGLG